MTKFCEKEHRVHLLTDVTFTIVYYEEEILAQLMSIYDMFQHTHSAFTVSAGFFVWYGVLIISHDFLQRNIFLFQCI